MRICSPSTRGPLASLLLTLLILAFWTGGCSDPGDVDIGPPIERDLAEIRARDTLVVLTTYNSTSYFLYRGQPLGFEYELIQEFAEDRGLHLRTVVVRNLDSLFVLLNEGVGDIAAARLVPAAIDTPHVAFTQALYRTEPSIVQRSAPPAEAGLPQRADSLLAPLQQPAPPARTDQTPDQPLPDSLVLQARLIDRPSELAGDTVHVRRRSAFYERLVELDDSLTGDIQVVEVGGDISPESLLRSVAFGQIRLTVTHDNLAKLTESYFTNLVVRPTIGDPYRVAWAVRRNAPNLRDTLDAWIEENRGDAIFDALYERYYVDRQGYRERVDSDYLTSETGRLSDYDELLQRNARDIGWDWRLLAAQTYQESRFQPAARSWAGAAGLLQLMPATAREFGVSNSYDPEQNVAGAVRFIQWLEDYWADIIPTDEERLRFILASYNTGHGHVEDARRLTVKYGGDALVWEDVAYWLLQKSKRQYYTDAVVKYGFCRGLEPVTYVSRILDRYDHYRQFVQADTTLAVAVSP